MPNLSLPLPHRWKWQTRSPAEMPDEIRAKLAYTETSILGGQVHQAVMYRPLLITLAGLIGFMVVIPLVPPSASMVDGVLVFALLGLFGWLWWKWVEWTHRLFFFTPYRIIYMHGIVTKTLAMLPMGKVTDMKYDRTPNGQVLGYGAFIIESAGQEQALRTLNFVPEPDKTYKVIVDWLFGKGTTNVNIIDVNMSQQGRSIPVSVRNMPPRHSDAGIEGEERRPWWNS